MIRTPRCKSGLFFLAKGVLVAQYIQDPICFLAPQMKGRIVGHPAYRVILVGVVCAFKIDIAFYQRRDHLGRILKVRIIVGGAMNNQIFSFNLVGMVNG